MLAAFQLIILFSSHLLSVTIWTGMCEVILSVVLYGCETWSLPLREKHIYNGVSKQKCSALINKNVNV
jgi:hypothetical protein